MRPILTLSLSAALLLSALTPMLAGAAAPVSVGPQYDTTHVYVAPKEPLNNAPQIRDTTRLMLRGDPCN
ncbi:hypothetical protein VDR77_17710 [Xanthomonas campestris pv. campestris]|nr:hypothetical protein [Xanthomonas campestris pv. campestris]